MWKLLPFVCLLVSSVLGQGGINLFTFSQIKEALLRGNELQVNADANRCDSTGLENNNVLFSIPLRHWQHVTLRTGAEEIRADDYYVDTFDPTISTFFLRDLNVYDDDTVELTLMISTFGSNETAVITLNCDIGVGAQFHTLINAQDLVEIDSYALLRSYLLLGDHIEAVGYLNECSNADEVITNGNQYVVGYQIQRFEVVRDAEPVEVLVIEDVSVASPSGTPGSVIVSTEQMIIGRDGSIAVTIVVFDGSLSNELVRLNLDCALGTSIKFTKHQREDENTWSTYDAIKSATLAGHDMELVAFVEYCSVLDGPEFDRTGFIVSARTDEFQLFKAGELWGEREYIAYSSWSIGTDADLYIDIARVYEDESMTIEYVIDERDTGNVTSGRLSCPLRISTVFHSVGRRRFPLTNYGDILDEIVRSGQTFEVEIDFDLCQTGGNGLNSIFGGIAWQTYIDTNPETGFFFADVFNLVEQRLSDPNTPKPAWNAAGLIMTPDGLVTIEARLYDFETGVNLAPSTENIVCALGAGVTFFRYP